VPQTTLLLRPSPPALAQSLHISAPHLAHEATTTEVPPAFPAVESPIPHSVQVPRNENAAASLPPSPTATTPAHHRSGTPRVAAPRLVSCPSAEGAASAIHAPTWAGVSPLARRSLEEIPGAEKGLHRAPASAPHLSSAASVAECPSSAAAWTGRMPAAS